MRTSFIMVPLIMSLSIGQEKPLPQSDRTLPVADQRSTETLPSFDLPDFVVTGRESIDLPFAEKKDLRENDSERTIDRPLPSLPPRGEPGASGGDVRRVLIQPAQSRMARVHLGIGSFSTFDIGAEGSGAVGGLHLGGEAAFSTTSGFLPNTEADRLRLAGSVHRPTSFLQGLMQHERLGFTLGFSREAYRWYGSIRPGDDRTMSFGSGSASMSGMLRNGSDIALLLEYAGGSIIDTTSKVNEGVFGIKGRWGGMIFDLPTDAVVHLMSGGKSGAIGGSYGGLDVSVGFRWDPIPLLSTRMSIGVASFYGEAGQQKTTLLPGFSAAFAITPAHRFLGTYAPRVAHLDIRNLVKEVPFVDATQPIRHAFARNRGTIGIESEWSPAIRTILSLESSTWEDYPSASDTGRSGLFRVFYGDVTETLLKASIVAKLPANHYFSAIAIVRSSKGSGLGLSVPYIPSAELRLSYRNEITEQFETEAVLQMVSTREAMATGPSSSVAGYSRMDVRVTYLVVSELKVWAAARNLLDAAIEHWAGYKESPFSLSIGLSYSL